MKLSKKLKIWIIVVAVIVLLPVFLYLFLLSSFAVQSIWLPMVKTHAGIEVKAEKCSVSLFSSRTFYAEKLTAEKPGELKASVGELSLSANPLGFLFSGELIVSDLSISKLNLEYTQPKAVAAQEPQISSPAAPAPSPVPEKTKKPLKFAVKKVELTESSVLFTDAQKNRYELSGISFSCTDFMPSGKPEIQFKSFFSMISGQMEIARTSLDGNALLELPAGSLIPAGIKFTFATGKTVLSGKTFQPLEASLAARLNASLSGERISVSASALNLKDAAGKDVLKAEIDGDVNLKSLSGKLTASLNTCRSELQDVLIRAYTGKQFRNAALTAKLTASIADSGNSIVADCSADLNADQLFEGIRAVGSKFTLIAAKQNDSILLKKIFFNVQDGDGKLKLTAENSSGFDWIFDLRKKTLAGKGSLGLRTVNLNIPQAAGILGAAGRVPVKSGLFSLDLNIAPSAANVFAVNGTFSLNQFVSTLGDAPAAPADFASVFALKVNTEKLGVVLESCRLTGSADRKEFLAAGLKFSAPDLKAGFPMTAEAVLSNLNENVFAVVPFKAVKEGNIKKFKTEMSAKWGLEKDGIQTVAVSGTVDDLLIAEAKQPLALSLGSNLVLDRKNKIRINALSLTSSEQHRDFFDLNVKGDYYFDAGLGIEKNNILVSSKFIDARKLQDIALLFKKKNAPAAAPVPAGQQTAAVQQTSPAPQAPAPVQGRAPVEPKEPAPLNLSRYNGVLGLAFEKIQYTDDVVLTLHGPLEIVSSQITMEDMKITANKAPVNIKFTIDTGLADGYVYCVIFSMKDLLLPPLIKAAMEGNDQGVTGTVSAVDMKFDGKGVTLPSIKKNLNGKVTASTAHLSFPALSAKAIDALNVLFIPLEAIPELTNALKTDSLTGDLKTLRDNVAGILDGSKNVEFEKGSIDVTVSKGLVSLNRFLFEGGTLKSESVTGKINLLTGTLDLAAALNLGILVIPMDIGGTLSKPAPDYKKFLLQFAKENIKNALNPDNIENTIKNVDSIIDLFKRKKKK